MQYAHNNLHKIVSREGNNNVIIFRADLVSAHDDQCVVGVRFIELA